MSKKQKTLDAVVGVTTERITVSDHSFALIPARVGERALFNRLAKAEQATLEGDEEAVREYVDLTTRFLNARDPQPGPVTPEWVAEQAANDVNEALIAIGMARGNRVSQQGQS